MQDNQGIMCSVLYSLESVWIDGLKKYIAKQRFTWNSWACSLFMKTFLLPPRSFFRLTGGSLELQSGTLRHCCGSLATNSEESSPNRTCTPFQPSDTKEATDTNK